MSLGLSVFKRDLSAVFWAPPLLRNEGSIYEIKSEEDIDRCFNDYLNVFKFIFKDRNDLLRGSLGMSAAGGQVAFTAL